MHTSLLDSLLNAADASLKTLSGVQEGTGRKNPAEEHSEAGLSQDQRKHIAGLMRVNHSGEICAQALYHGQALTAKLKSVRASMQQAAQEEGDHLHWCRQRIEELESNTSLLDPLWYGSSFALGALAGFMGDRVSLGFVAEIENQVCSHIQSHIDQLPENDLRTRAILELMKEDECRHEHKALGAGGIRFPRPVRKLMSASSKLMTMSSYKI